MRYFIVDAFTEQAFKGNPAAVVIVDQAISDDHMQAIAAEFNLAETAFVYEKETQKKERGNNHWALRWFTPTTEVNLCGHATLASAYVLWNELKQDTTTLRFDTLSGELSADQVNGQIELDFPSIAYQNAALEPSMLLALQLDPIAIVKTNEDLFVEVADESIVRHYQPDFSLITQLEQRSLVITARANNKVDFVSRMFAPKIGIPEDPVTGAIHCSLALYWAEKLGKQSLLAYQASKRGGYLSLTVKGDRVLLGGNAVCTMQGQLRV